MYLVYECGKFGKKYNQVIGVYSSLDAFAKEWANGRLFTEFKYVWIECHEVNTRSWKNVGMFHRP